MRLRWLAPWSVVLAFATESMAQSRMTGGDIQGTVVDQQNENVGGADVTVTNLDTNVSRRMAYNHYFGKPAAKKS